MDPRARRAWVEGGTLLGAGGSRVHGARTRDAARHGVAHRRGRPDHGRRIRAPGPQIRHVDRQPRIGGRGHCRRTTAARQRQRESGSVLGRARRRRQFRHRDELRIPAAPDAARSHRGIGELSDRPGARRARACTREYAATAPDELYLDPCLVLPPGGASGVVSVEVCYSGPHEKAERALAPLRKLGTPEQDTIKAQDYVDVQRSNDTGDSRAIASYLKGGFISTDAGQARLGDRRRHPG